jgi:hypothetical protein
VEVWYDGDGEQYFWGRSSQKTTTSTKASS